MAERPRGEQLVALVKQHRIYGVSRLLRCAKRDIERYLVEDGYDPAEIEPPARTSPWRTRGPSLGFLEGGR